MDPIDDAYWIAMMGTRWSQPSLTAADVVSILGLDHPADLSRHALKMPRPACDEHSKRWSRAAIYDYITVHRPQLQARIPRLYPFTTALRPARFLFGQVVDEMAVHAWQPSDGRGPVAVAYCGPAQNDGELHLRAEPLLARLPWATAVCCPHTATCTADDDARQPYVAVADRNHPVDDNYGWFEVVGLLRVDLPWWPAALRDLDAIAAWQPGAPVQRIRARIGEGPNPRRLGALLTTETPEYVHALVGRAIEFLDRQAASEYVADSDHHKELPARRGLMHAAVADIDLTRTVPDITEAEAALLLHQPCADSDAAADILSLLTWCSPIANVLPIPIASNPLAAEWMSRLQPADGPELGFWKARFASAVDVATQEYTDPLNPHCWVVATADTLYPTVGRSVPATGQLSELFYDQRGGLFRDSAGQVWPLPATGFGSTGTGPSGGRAGREALVKILMNLILDASGDVTRREAPYSPTSRLAELVARTDPPLVIRAGDAVLAIEDL